MQSCDNVGRNLVSRLAHLPVVRSCMSTSVADGPHVRVVLLVVMVPSNMDIADRLYVASHAWLSTERQRRR